MKGLNKLKLISSLFVFVFTILCCMYINDINVYAAETTINGVTYKTSNSDKTLTITGSGTVTKDWQTTSGNWKGADYVSKITVVVFNSSSITSCNTNAFNDCTKLATVRFYKFNNGVIDTLAFKGNTNITTVVLGNYNHSTSTAKETTDITEIGNNVFDGCTNLSLIRRNANAYTCSVCGGRSENKHTSDSCSGSIQSHNNVIVSSITKIGNYAFRGTALTKLTINDKITTIGTGAFQNCSKLETVKIGKLVESIGSNAFSGCSNIATLNYTAVSIKTYNDAFSNKNIASVSINANVTKLPDNFIKNNKSVTSITIPDNVESVGSYAFNGCSKIDTLTLGKNLTTLGKDVFNGCSSLATVKFNSIDLSTTETTFTNFTSITKLVFGGSVTQVPANMFNGCTNLKYNGSTTLTLGAKIHTVGAGAFKGCTTITAIKQGAKLTTIGDSAFEGCTSLNKIYYVYTDNKGTSDTSDDETVTVNHALRNVKTVGNSAFKGCTSLTQLNTYTVCTSIGNNAFENCTSLTDFTFGKPFKTLGTNVFKGCTNFKTLTLNCSNIDSFNGNFGAQISSVNVNGKYEYRKTAECYSTIETVKITNNVESIPDFAFTNNKSIKNIIHNSGKINTDANRLKALGLMNKVIGKLTKIGKYAFAGCSNLDTMWFSPKASDIGEGAYEFFLDAYSQNTTDTLSNRVEVSHSVEKTDTYYSTGIAELIMEVKASGGVTSVTEVSQDYVFILDVTGSMAAEVKSTITNEDGTQTVIKGSKMNASGIAFEELLDTMREYSPNSNLAVVGFFSGDCYLLSDFSNDFNTDDKDSSRLYKLAKYMQSCPTTGTNTNYYGANFMAKFINTQGLTGESVQYVLRGTNTGGTDYPVGMAGALQLLATRDRATEVNVIFMSDGGHNAKNGPAIVGHANNLAAIAKQVWSIGLCVERETVDSTIDWSDFTYIKDTIEKTDIDDDGNEITTTEKIITGIYYNEDLSYDISDLAIMEEFTIEYEKDASGDIVRDLNGNPKVKSVKYTESSTGQYDNTWLQKVSANNTYFNIGNSENVAVVFANKFKSFVAASSSTVTNLQIEDFYNTEYWEPIIGNQNYPTEALTTNNTVYMPVKLGIKYDEETGKFSEQENTYSVYLKLKENKRETNPQILVSDKIVATYNIQSRKTSYEFSVTDDTNLYLDWKNAFKITLDNQRATYAGTPYFYELYSVGNFTEYACDVAISKITVPTRTGYRFGGYWTNTGGKGTQWIDANGNIKSTSTTFEAATTLYAQWTANVYYVGYYKGLTNNNTPTTDATSHTYDADVTLAANKFVGRSYTVTFNGNKPTGTIGTVQGLPANKTGNLTFKNWYVDATYNDGYYTANTNLGKKNFESTHGARAKATAQWNSVTLTWTEKPTLVGYTFLGWKYPNGTDAGTSLSISPAASAYSNTIYAQWKARDDIKYVVNHWVQNLDAESDNYTRDNFTLKESEEFKGTADTYVTPAVKYYENYVSPAPVTVKIEADGSTVVNYYYLRQKVSLDIDGKYIQQYFETTSGLCTFDIYINDKRVGNDVTEYKSDKVLYGSKWYINDIRIVPNREYTGSDIKTELQ